MTDARMILRKMRGPALLLALATVASALVGSGARAEPAEPASPSWDALRPALFADRPMKADPQALRISGPKRAEDAALVPITITLAADAVPRAQRLSLIVDNNPAPVAATFDFADAYRTGDDIGDRTIDLRIRLDAMSAVRAILETTDGNLIEASQFVTGSGGCSTTAVKDLEEALRGLGQMRVKIASDATRGPAWNEVQMQIRHPNFSGMQIDARTNTYTPAHFIDRINVDVGADRLVTIVSGIAISEDPNFRLSFARSGERTVTLVARDSEKNIFRSRTE